MGTLQNQPRRMYVSYTAVKEGVDELKELLGPDLSTEVALQAVVKLVELDFKQQDRDVKDEQLAGFGELLEAFIRGYQNDQ
jgi:hypothetical protein